MSFHSYAQRDSLDQIISTSDNDTILMNTYLAISDLYYRVYPDSCQHYALKSLEYAEKIKDPFYVPTLNNIVGLCELHKENYRTALDWFQIALDGFLKIDKPRSTLMQLNNIGAAYSELQQPIKALPYLLKAQEFSEIKGHTDVLLLTELNLGNVYEDLGQDSLAEEYFKLSRSRTTLESDPYNYALNTYNIGNVIYRDSSRIPEALEYLLESYQICKKNQFHNLSFMPAQNLLSYYLLENEPDSSLAWIRRGEQALEFGDNPTSRLFIQIGYGGYYRNIDKLDSSLYHLKLGKDLALEVQEEDAKFKLDLELSMTYEAMGDFAKALDHYRRGNELRQEIYNSKNTQIFADLKSSHEIEKRDQAIAMSKKDNAIKDQKIEANQNRIRLFIWGTVILVILLGFIVYFLIQKNKGNKLLKEQNSLIEIQRASIEHKQTEILDSINYASRIQSAILPEKETLKSQLQDGFVLYIPKDVVSGDFYWTERISENKILVAVADCTGHGVPGAMVSVVCNNALNRSVREFSLSNPAKILDKTREIVESEFEQSTDLVKDGMDISLALVDFEHNKINWAGANNPLWVQKKAKPAEIIEYKADKQPIGHFHVSKPFTSHEIQIERGDRVYLFSDGYADQFGGPKGKKFKYKALKELLATSTSDSMEELRVVLENAFFNWKGDYEQIDDICMIGIAFEDI